MLLKNVILLQLPLQVAAKSSVGGRSDTQTHTHTEQQTLAKSSLLIRTDSMQMQTHTHTQTHKHTHKHTHTYIHTLTHTYTHTQSHETAGRKGCISSKTQTVNVTGYILLLSLMLLILQHFPKSLIIKTAKSQSWTLSVFFFIF